MVEGMRRCLCLSSELDEVLILQVRNAASCVECCRPISWLPVVAGPRLGTPSEEVHNLSGGA